MRRRVGTTPRRELQSRGQPALVPGPIPLIHLTAVGLARDIVVSGQIETSPCKVFGQDLLYFFALKPAYRLKAGDQKSTQINRFPFAFVMSPSAVPIPFHVYPFDTGAAHENFYSAADPYVCLEDYELEPTHAAVAGQIGWAFGSVEAYMNREIRTDILDDVPVHETVTRGFVDIARMASAGSNRPDERASAIEIACSHHVRLDGNVELAIIPRQYLEGEDGDSPNEDFIDRLIELNIPLATYDWQPNRTPNEFRDEIERIIRNHYQRPVGAPLS